MRLVALDLHQDVVVSATLDPSESQPEVRVATYGIQKNALSVFLATFRHDDIVIVESTTNAFWMYRKIEPRVQACYVLNTNAVHLRGNKTDSMDARKLLQILMGAVLTKTESTLPTVYVPSEEVTKLRSLFGTCSLMNKMSTQCKNRIHSLYRQNGIVIEKTKLEGISYRATLLEAYPLEDFWREQVELLIEELEIILQKIERVKQSMLYLAGRLFAEELDLLISIPGFSPFTASAFMSDVCDISRFQSAKKLCAYLKTVPSIRSSNKTTHIGPVPKAGRSLTVTLLTQSVVHLKKASPHYAEFYTRLRKGKSAGKTRVALIRKTIVGAYYMLLKAKQFANVDPAKVAKKRIKLDSYMRGYVPPVKEKTKQTA